MNDVRELYGQMIIDHGRKPRNFHLMADHTAMKVGYNPLCGDKLVLYVKVENKQVVDASFQGEGCAISMASASMMTEALKGKSLEEATTLFGHFHHMVTEGLSDEDESALGKLAILSGVNAYPARVKCASLAWQTLNAALSGDDNDVSTE